MALDRRTTRRLVQALLHAKNKMNGRDALDNVAQTSMPTRDRAYGAPMYAGARFSSASQPGVAAGDKAADQSHRPILALRQHQFGDSRGLLFTGEVADTAKDRGNLAGEALHQNMSPVGGHSSVRPAAQPTAREYRPSDGGLYWSKEATHRGSNLPRVRYPTSGEIWWEFLGGIGKGVAQTLADIGAEETKYRQAMVDGIYIDTPYTDLFDPPTSPWDNAGREIAPGIMATTKPVKQKPKTWYDKKIGKVEPPKHLIPGTTRHGDYMHEHGARFVTDSFPEAKFDVRVKPGQKGIDLTRIAGPDHIDKYWEIKTNKPHSQRELKRQIQRWGYDEPSVRVIAYDEYGNLYDGFGR